MNRISFERLIDNSFELICMTIGFITLMAFAYSKMTEVTDLVTNLIFRYE